MSKDFIELPDCLVSRDEIVEAKDVTPSDNQKDTRPYLEVWFSNGTSTRYYNTFSMQRKRVRDALDQAGIPVQEIVGMA